MATVEFRNVGKVFDNGFVAVRDFSLKVNDGELMVLVGPSGCGKSTLLRILAGLDEATTGDVLIDDVVVTYVAPRNRDIAMVFQSYALYPHLTVRENIEFGLKIHNLPEDEIAERVRTASDLLGLTEVLDRRPKQLSGGQRQRVAMGRALVREPRVFLMDEPLSNLDAKLRVRMRSEIGLLQQRLGTTMLYVTHDQVEAMTMGDRVVVMREGAILQVGTPKEIYTHPVDRFVAAFLGSPSMNLAEATVARCTDEHLTGRLWLQIGSQRLLLPESVLAKCPRLLELADSDDVLTMGVRPEDMEDAHLIEVPPFSTLRAKVAIVEELGAQTMVHFGLDARSVQGEDRADFAIGSALKSDFVAAFNPKTAVHANDEIDIALDLSRIHFFDGATGVNLAKEASNAQ